MRMNVSRRASGYTLIEILVVLFIISIVSTVALLSINLNDKRQIEAFANDLSQVVLLAEEQAMLQPQVLGLKVNTDSWQFAGYQAEDKGKPAQWVMLDDNVLGKHAIPGGMEVTVETGSDKGKNQKDTQSSPQVIISTNGDTTPFTIYVGKKGAKPLFAITGDADGHVTTKDLS